MISHPLLKFIWVLIEIYLRLVVSEYEQPNIQPNNQPIIENFRRKKGNKRPRNVSQKPY